MIGFISTVGIALVTVLVSCVLDCCKNISSRLWFLPGSVLFLAILSVLANPPLTVLLPFVIVLPLPTIEKWTGTLVGKLSIFSGSVLAATCYFILRQYGSTHLDVFWQEAGVVWLLCSLGAATLIFLGIALGQKFLSRIPQGEPAGSGSGKKPESVIQKTNGAGAVVLVLLVLWIAYATLGFFEEGDMCGGRIPISLVDPSFDPFQIPNTTIVRLSAEDAGRYPEFVSFVQLHRSAIEKNKKSMNGNDGSTAYLGVIYFPCGTESRLYEYQVLENYEPPATYVAYDGNVYFLGRGGIA